MLRASLTLSTLLLAVAVPVAAAGTATVAFVDPDRFTDAGQSRENPSERDLAVLRAELEKHVQELAARYLRDGESVDIEVLDIDLAGRFQPSARLADVRIVRDIDWPRFRVRSTLTRDGVAQPPVEERLSSPSFLMSINRYGNGDRLRYEKAMLDDWCRERFATR